MGDEEQEREMTDCGNLIFEDKYIEGAVRGLSINALFLVAFCSLLFFYIFSSKTAMILAITIAGSYLLVYYSTTVRIYDLPTFRIYENYMMKITPPKLFRWDNLDKVELIWMSIFGLDSKRGVDMILTKDGERLAYIPTNLERSEREKIRDIIQKKNQKIKIEITDKVA
jgi:hypothetical protein